MSSVRKSNGDEPFFRDPLSGAIPVTLITGFLGSGKTTLITQLLRHPGMNRVAVVINEVGEIGIDHDLVTMSSENISLLANGCICCSFRTDLQETLRELFAARHIGQMLEFDRVIIETTGLADPAPVVQTLSSDTLLAAHFRLDGVVTLVDAFNGSHQLLSQPEAVKQIALADRIILTKTDLVSRDQVQELKASIWAMRPDVDILTCLHGALAPETLMGLGLQSRRSSDATLSFLGEPLQNNEAKPQRGEAYLGERHSTKGKGRLLHDASIQTSTLRFHKPFLWTAFSTALEVLTQLRGPDLLRVKGIVNVEGRPVVVQGVQHLFHPPVELDRWPSADQDTRLVFITKNMKPQTLEGLLNAIMDVA
jgi:G3E family GTPase